MLWSWILIIVLFLLSIALTVGLVVAIKRLLQFDAFFQMLVGDIIGARAYLDRMLSREMFSNAPEVIAFHNTMRGIVDKMEVYSTAIKNGKNRRLLKEAQRPPDRRPVVI